ncbi:MAG: L-serine ammonia-lyase, iron-sulfur-dependent subunit beta [Halanaerobium sp.]|nr:L-serine ammonia-lyase, iron-sulfur-dependent subunit beta [Halanaerobium sp.]
MQELSAFDLIGPVMIGPSSSHTAGAVRIGLMCREVADSGFNRARILLHGSFARTFKGHGTDRAIMAGLLGMSPSDERIKDSFQLARQHNIGFEFIATNLGNFHSNTARVILEGPGITRTDVLASSIGGGNIVIKEINGYQVDLAGDYHTLITWHDDKPGVIARITNILDEFHLNIAFMKVFRKGRGSQATAIIQLDEIVDELIPQIEKVSQLIRVKLIRPVL